MNKKKTIAIMATAVVFCIAMLFIASKPFLNRPTADSDIELGNFDYKPAAEEYQDQTDQYDPSMEAGSELDSNNVYITNYEILYDFLPINAAGSVSVYAAEFLNDHGYGGYHELTVLEDTISSDKSYPRFLCIIDDTEKYLEIRYRSDAKEFSFALTNTIY